MVSVDKQRVEGGRSAHVSVVIPAYQAERFVAEAVRSVLEQDDQPLEVIVVDDGSTDDTAEVVDGLGSSVTLISKDHAGEASARNAGLRAAKGEWVAFLDADDRWLPGRLVAVRDRIRGDPSADLFTSDGFIEAGGEITGRCYGPNWSFEHDHQRTEILRRNFVFGHVVARRRRLVDLGGFDESIEHTTDWEMWIRLLLDGGRIALVDRPLSVYRVHTGSLSADRAAMARGSLRTLARAAANPAITPPERAIVDDTIAQLRSTLERSRMTEALAERDPRRIRRRATEVARCRDQPPRSRAKAVVAVALPRVAAYADRRRKRGYEVGTMGHHLPTTRNRSTVVPALRGSTPLVSVILPFFDEVGFLARSVESIRRQTCGSWELLLVDDGSTDGSQLLADRFANDDPRIRVFRHPGGVSRGRVASRSLGIARARAAVTAFIDTGHVWQPDKLERQLVQLADHPEAAMVCAPTWSVRLDNESTAVERVVPDAPVVLAPGHFGRRLVMGKLVLPPPSVALYRTSALRAVGGVPLGGDVYENQRTCVAVSQEHPVFVGDVPLASCAVRPDSLHGPLEHDHATKWCQERDFHLWIGRHFSLRGRRGVLLVMFVIGRRTGAWVRQRAIRPVTRVKAATNRSPREER